MRVSAGELRILPTDELAFGPKQQARYKPDEMKTKDLLAALVRAAPRRWASVAASTSAIERKTVEADVLLHRAGAEISVDFKYTAAGTRSLERAQLLGVGVALATGEISNAHFVCNGCFDRTTQQRVDDVNRLMLEWNTGQVSLHSEYAWRV